MTNDQYKAAIRMSDEKTTVRLMESGGALYVVVTETLTTEDIRGGFRLISGKPGKVETTILAASPKDIVEMFKATGRDGRRKLAEAMEPFGHRFTVRQLLHMSQLAVSGMAQAMEVQA